LKKDTEDEDKHIIASGLQPRWTSPYEISKKFSPVLYECEINKIPSVIHLFYMKLDSLMNHLPMKTITEKVDELTVKAQRRAKSDITKMEAILSRDNAHKLPENIHRRNNQVVAEIANNNQPSNGIGNNAEGIGSHSGLNQSSSSSRPITSASSSSNSWN
jgi:hypothetical protein